jgi:hypothetical protein
MMTQVLTQETIASILQRLHQSNMEFSTFYPGDSPTRQPVHTFYGGAQIFKADTARKLGATALNTLKEYAPTSAAFAKALGLKGKISEHKILYNRIVEKLKLEPVEDFRIDFEDGYGNRPDSEEDYHAEFTAEEVAKGMRDRTLPPFIGIRIKPFTEDLKARAIRTLDIFVSTLLEKSGGTLPDNFVVTLPKVVTVEQVTALVNLFELLESKNNLPRKLMKLELMIETPQSIINSRGECALPSLVNAAKGRCVAAHFGVYDYTASMNITAAHQSMDHPACDFAREMMKVSLAGTGIWLSDGATNVLPVGPHRASKNGKPLTAKQKNDNREAVYRAWRLAFKHTTHALKNGYYQGWDLHPAQLPVRYAAVYSFFRDGLELMSNRLKTFVEKAAQATLIGDVMDDAATGQGLLNFFLRGINCGAITEDEATATGLTVEEIRARSFMKILKMRKKLE